jgi:hypothetical protein
MCVVLAAAKDFKFQPRTIEPSSIKDVNIGHNAALARSKYGIHAVHRLSQYRLPPKQEMNGVGRQCCLNDNPVLWFGDFHARVYVAL